MELKTAAEAGAGELRDRPSHGLPAWCTLAVALILSLTAAYGVVRLQRLTDGDRQTELALLRAAGEADGCRAVQLRGLGRGALTAQDAQDWTRQSGRMTSAMNSATALDPRSGTLAHVGRAFGHYRQGEVKEQQALAAHQAASALSLEAVQTDAAWRLFRQSGADAADEYDRRAARTSRMMEVATGLAFLSVAVCLAWSFRRFGRDRYAGAALETANGALRRSEKRFRSLVQNASEVVAILDEAGAVTYLSPVVRRLWGHTPESLAGKPVFDLLCEDDRGRVRETFGQTCARAGKNFTVEARVRHGNGSWRVCQLVMVNLLAQPEVGGIVVTFRDITELKAGEEALRQAKDSLEVRVRERTADLAQANSDLARANVELQSEIAERRALETERERLLAEALERADHDPLTGLLNHRAFHKRFQEEADRALRQSVPLAVAVLDLDNFKFFNDAYGHLVGDDVLRRVADVLQSCCRSYDTLARFGGDEFALLMPGTGSGEAPRLAERLRQRLAEAEYLPPGADTPIPLSLSMGISVFPDDEAARLDALELADARLLRSKTGAEDTDEAYQLRKSLNDSVAGFSMLDALVTAVNNKDRYTRRHSEDVLAYSLQIAQEMGVDETLQGTLATAALLHDVGKIGVPDHILRKPGHLSDDEFEVIKHHPMMGSVIVAAVPGLEETLDAVRHHHERWDGGGYPFGLRGLEIPFSARLMAVADAFSAMTTDRPYRKGFPEAKAFGFLEEGAGTQWDPDCVHAFLTARRRLNAEAENAAA